MFFHHLTGVLSADECDALIARGKAQGFVPALVNNRGTQEMMTHIRNNERVEFDDSSLANELVAKLIVAMGDQFPYLIKDCTYVKVGDHFRMYRYVPGQYFKPHRDGSFQDKELESEVTVLFYLNDTDGGETVLMPYGYQQTWSHQLISPRAGDVLLFEHKIVHEGRPVNSGEKYVLRTDLFYKHETV